MLGESDVPQLDGAARVEKWGKERGRSAVVGKHLVGHGVLVGEPLAARQIFVNRGDDLQDVVVRGQS